MSESNPAIVVDKLSKCYPGTDKPAVDNLSFQIERGEIFGLLGPNGAGKTTTMSILCGTLRPDSGNIRMLGLPQTGNLSQIKAKLGVVPQEIALYPTLTARENLHFFGKMYGLKSAALTIRIKELLEIFGLTDKADKQVQTFSGGMKRRLNLMAAVLHRPEILALDEPTVGVDAQSRQAILSFLSKINAEGATLLYTSHHLDEAAQLCHRVAIMDFGNIIAIGTPQELVSKNRPAKTLEEVFLNLTGRKLRD